MTEKTSIDDLVILGTGVHALEMAEIVERRNDRTPTWNLVGFVEYADGDPKLTNQNLNGYPVVGTQHSLGDFPSAYFVPDNVWPRDFDIPYQRLTSIVDPTAFVSRTARIGRGCVLFPGCYMGLNASIGDYVFCLGGCIINHDDVVDDRTVMASGVALAGFVQIGPDCYLGQSCTIRQYSKVGAHCLVGMGAVVVGDIPAEKVVVGNPARVLRDNTGS